MRHCARAAPWLLGAWLGLCAPTTTAAAVAEPAKLIVLGADAVSLNILEPFMEAGVTPNLKALIEEGGCGDLLSIWPLRTPQVWTTIVTGKYPGQHGIWDHYTNSHYFPPPLRSEEKRRTTTRDRRSQALWNILDAAQIPTLVVGWVASWPAEQLKHGVIAAPAVLLDPRRQVSIKGSFWKGVEGQIAPRKLQPLFAEHVVEGADLAPEDVVPFADLPPEGHPIYQLPYMKKYVKTLKWSIARATTVEALTLALLPVAHPQVVLAYFQCADSLLHRFWIFQKSVDDIRQRLASHNIPTEHAEELRQRFGRVVEACYRDIDARVARILEASRGPETTVLFISDHGFGEAPFPHPKKAEPYGGNHLDNGVIVAAAPGIPAGTRLAGISVLDLAPTLLHLFDREVGKDMPGRVIKELLPPERANAAVRYRPSYEKRPQNEIPFRKGWPSRKFRQVAADR